MPSQPFFEDNALQLLDLALIDIIPLYNTAARVGSHQEESSAPKLIKVPRQVRDYVITIISIELAARTGDSLKKLALLEHIDITKESIYSQARIIVARAEAKQELGRRLSNTELQILMRVYSYLYTQRFPHLLDGCHRALWTELEHEADITRLVRLFKFSSFVWRIRGG